MSQLPTLGQIIGGGASPQSIPSQQNQQQNMPQSNYPTFQPGYAQFEAPVNVFRNEIVNQRTQYGMNIEDNQIDNTIEEAKRNKRMYEFPEKDKNYIRYDEKGKSYILVADTFDWAHKNNKEYFKSQNMPNSYTGVAAHLIKVCWLEVKLAFAHVKPGNYQLFVNQAFENSQIQNQIKCKVLVGDKEVFSNNSYPNNEMAQHKNLTETLICTIKKEDFDMGKLDKNGDAVVKLEFGGNNNSWKKGWSLDGARLLAV